MSDAGTKVLFIAAEATPIINIGGLADVAGALPKALQSIGCDVRLMLPAYGAIDRTRWEVKPSQRPFRINLGGEPQVAQICTGSLDGVHVYYLDHAPTFSNRPMFYAGHGDPARFVIFCALALAALDHLDWRPDILHLNDWHTAIIARWQRSLRREVICPPTVLTIHTLDEQGIVYRPDLGWAGSLLPQSPDQIINLLYEGLANADTITTVSPTYAQEITTPEHGAGLHHVLCQRQTDLVGILNGIDTETYDPSTDQHIAEQYSAGNSAGKISCKQALQQEAGLAVRADVPLFGMVTRLKEQAGMDILAQALPDLLTYHDMQLVILGDGDPHYRHLLSSIADRFCDKLKLWLHTDAALTRRIYAGSDAFLVPSRVEPCGRGQMIAMRYGTLPVVRSTGGLADTVKDMDYPDGTGVQFEPYCADALAHAVQRTVEGFRNKALWHDMMERGMQRDWSWSGVAQRYADLYERTIDRHRSIMVASI